MVRTQFGQTVEVIRLDNALELNKSYEILEFFAKSRICLQTSCVQTPHKMVSCKGNTSTY